MYAHRPKPWFSKARSEQGFTLVEILVSLGLTALVLGLVMAPVVLAAHHESSELNYTWAQQRARTGLNQIVREVRQSWQVLSATPNSVEMNIEQGGSNYTVYYECDIPQPSTQYRECVGVSAPLGNSLPSLSTGKVIVANLLNGTVSSPVFSFAPSSVAPYYMTATVQVPASNGRSLGLNHSMTFSDGALMRNLNIGN